MANKDRVYGLRLTPAVKGALLTIAGYIDLQISHGSEESELLESMSAGEKRSLERANALITSLGQSPADGVILLKRQEAFDAGWLMENGWDDGEAAGNISGKKRRFTNAYVAVMDGLHKIVAGRSARIALQTDAGAVRCINRDYRGWAEDRVY